MRHRVYGKHLGRNEGQRQVLFKGLVQALFLRGTIQTSETKAKAIKGLVDRIITLAKGKNTQVKLQSYLPNKNLQNRLIKEILPLLGSRTSGYTKLVRMGTRLGDQTTMVKMSLIGAEQLKPIVQEKISKEEKTLTVKEDKTVKKDVSEKAKEKGVAKVVKAPINKTVHRKKK